MFDKTPPQLKGELQQLTKNAGSQRSFARLVEHAQFISELHIWTKNSLGRAHLVDVAHTLHSELEISLEHLALLELPIDILEMFPGWRNGSRQDFRVSPLDVRLPLVGTRYPMHVLRLQLSPFSVTLSAALLLIRSLLHTLDPSVKLHIAVEPGGNIEALAGVIGDFHPTASERVILFELEMATVFAQDNARGARDSRGEPALLIPRSFRKDRDRSRDSLDRQVERDLCGLPIYRSRVFWEGGNILNDDSSCFIGIDHIRENMHRLGLSEEEVRELFTAEFGDDVVFLGEPTFTQSSDTSNKSGQAAFHIDLDIGLLGRLEDGSPPIALLASPTSTLEHIPEVLQTSRLVSDHFLDETAAKELIEFEYRAYAEERQPILDLYRAALVERGYRVIEMPDLRISPSDNLFSTRNLDFTYCNILCGLKDKSPTIFYLPYKLNALDKLAEQAFLSTGSKVQKVSKTSRLANLLMLFRGGLRCACGQIY